jgi:hypothetical protein
MKNQKQQSAPDATNQPATSELIHSTGSLSFDPTDATVLWILGRPFFWCASIAAALRRSGRAISYKDEDEQAAVIIWMLQKYQQHGENWRQKGDEELKKLYEANSAISSTQLRITLERWRLFFESREVCEGEAMQPQDHVYELDINL